MSISAIAFKIGSEEYSIPISFIRSIEKIEGISNVKNMPTYMRGTVTIGGECFPVFDLGYMLYNEMTEITPARRMIIIETEELSYSLLVYDIDEVIQIPEAAMRKVGLTQHMKYCSSIVQLDHRLLTMIDPVGLLDGLERLQEIKIYLSEEKQKV